jgi:hypothetical protein
MSSLDDDNEEVMEMEEESPTPDSVVKTLNIIWDDDKIEKVCNNDLDIVVLFIIFLRLRLTYVSVR